jgi:hypothetical protein
MDNMTIEQKAAMWDALRSCERIRLFGTGSLGDPTCQHIGLELWAKYPIDDFPNGRSNHEFSKGKFLEYVKAMVAPEPEPFPGQQLSPAKMVLMEHVGACMHCEIPKSLSETNQGLWKAFERGRKFERLGGQNEGQG